MTFTIRGVHLAIAGAFLAGILIAGGVVFALGGDDGDKAQPAQQASADNLEVAPTSVPTVAPSATPAPLPTAVPTAAPQIRTCAEIRATGTYNSDEERAFFLANCVNQPAAGGGAATNPPPSTASSAQATAEEANYRTKAEAAVTVMAVKLQQWADTLGNSPIDQKFLEFGTTLRGFAQEIDRLPTPPARFAQVHAALRAQFVLMADHIIAVQNITNQKQADAWLKRYFEIFESMDGALQDFALVVGIKLPSVFTGE